MQPFASAVISWRGSPQRRHQCLTGGAKFRRQLEQKSVFSRLSPADISESSPHHTQREGKTISFSAWRVIDSLRRQSSPNPATGRGIRSDNFMQHRLVSQQNFEAANKKSKTWKKRTLPFRTSYLVPILLQLRCQHPIGLDLDFATRYFARFRREF